jgi:putative aldouronate transport system permease protein
MVMTKKRKKNPVQETLGDRIYLVFVYVFLIGALLITLYPLIFIVSASISTPHYVNSGQMWLWPMGITLEGYRILIGNTFIWQ